MERLKQLREAKGLTQVKVSIELNVSQETISGYEIGKAVPPAEALSKMADIYDCSVDYILGRTDVKTLIRASELSSQETELIEAFRKLGMSKKERAIGMVIALVD